MKTFYKRNFYNKTRPFGTWGRFKKRMDNDQQNAIDAENKREGARIGADIAKVSAQERTKAAELGRKIADKLLDQD